MSAHPTAWRHATMEDGKDAGMHNIISDEVKRLWLLANPTQAEHYTIPLYDEPLDEGQSTPMWDICSRCQLPPLGCRCPDANANMLAALREIAAGTPLVGWENIARRMKEIAAAAIAKAEGK